MTEQDTHTPLDTLLGASPRHVLRHWLSLLVLAIAALAALVFFVRFVTGEDSPYYSAPVERGDLTPLVSERGIVRGAGELTVPAGVAGRMTWTSAKTNGAVSKGELLAVIDAGQVKTAVEIDRSRLAAAEASLEGAQAAAHDTGARLARFESVWKRSGGRAPSLNEIERARTEARQAALAVSSAKAEVRAAQLQLGDDRRLQAGAEVRAPIDGTLVMRHAQPGQVVAQGQPLFTIAAGLSPLTVDVPLAGQSSAQIKAGTQAQVRLDALPDVPQSAALTLLRVTPPPQSTPPRAVFTLSRPDPRVKPGMPATVEIELPARRGVLLVPDAALQFDPANRHARRRERIYILEAGEPRRVYVTVGGSDGKRTEVFANGLEPGQQVIIGWRDGTSGPEASGR
ncbi:efflux RND transporter periplasmic adaptor subunit [Novosphingobium sp. FGD1]|uniref:Efflux RND transporter periplasmic adaptor subunit n=1 Tax=Novosphingobium silvae TaxID=2692619 RepID=A0A7X4GDN7_9SPHN|nr:efflux RND transporter periplasmic adaptor subunit [Novosphingobium silvae]